MRSLCFAALLLALTCSAIPLAANATPMGHPAVAGTPSPSHRIVPMRGATPLAPQSPPPHLSYYGGPVIGAVRVVVVLYGAGVAPAIANGIPTFYQQLVSSSHISWLCEYDTYISDIHGDPGTHQAIHPGSLNATITITPDPGRNGSIITDANIQDELSAQFAAGNLPAPDSSMLYMVHFPPGKTIEIDATDRSCQQFCAYHWCFYDGGRPVRYGVMPDLAACADGCGGSNDFNATTITAWHEVAEAITDPDTSLSWYDADEFQPGNQWGEIADICDDIGNDTTTVIAGNGVAYVLQTLWSNRQNACAISGPSCVLAVANEPADPRIALDLESANPVQGEVRFRVHLGAARDVDLAVFDVAGRRVAELMRGDLGAGDHVALWQPTAHPGAPAAGVYFARLRAGGRTLSKTLIVSR